IENRHTVGVDARWRFGAFTLDPTVMYQFGHRDQTVPVSFTNGLSSQLKEDAWLFDVRGGWQAGPLLLELAGIYTTGNEAKDRIDRNASRIKFYQPISTDSGFYTGWAEIWALGIDYFNAINQNVTGLNPIVSIGYDKYGLIRFGTRASYALTPAYTAQNVNTGIVMSARNPQDVQAVTARVRYTW